MFCLRPCDASQEPSGNCSEKLVRMNILGGFFQVDFPPVTVVSPAEILNFSQSFSRCCG